MRILLLILPMLLGACASSPSVRDVGALPVYENSTLPAPSSQDLLASTRPYLIGPFDKLAVEVFGIEDLSRDEVQVDSSGQVSLPLVGVLDAAGRTPAQLARVIEGRLENNFVRNPQVIVNLKETVSQVVTVDGQVQNPGLYPVIGNMTLMRAVATSGGLAEFADLQDVVVFRTVDGQRMAGLYNLEAIRAGMYDDPQIYANDVVVVGDSQSRRIFKDVLQAAPLLTTPLIILFRN